MSYAGIEWQLRPNDFGHVGVFPEQEPNWRWIAAQVERCRAAGVVPEVLNLFGYTGGSTLAAARAGASVCHVDASKTSVRIARENAEASGLGDASVRWIIEDALLFIDREIRRGRRYHAVILDPPSYGRGRRGEVWQLEEMALELLAKCRTAMTDDPRFLLLTGHSPGFTPLVLANLVADVLGGVVESGEMEISGADGRALPSGAFARWSAA
jgi:23S rRNA (cytosine1962-C5)-methyltransferase